MDLLPEYALSRIDTIHCVDALTLLWSMPAQSADAIITDLPYGSTACSWDTIIPFEPLWAAVKHALKPRGVFVTTASEPFASILRVSNLDWYKYDWTWVKTKASDFINSKNKPMKRHEVILVFSDGTTANCSPIKMNYYPQGLKPFGQIQYRPHGTINTQVIGHRPSYVNEYLQELTNYPSSVLEFPNGNNFNIHPTQKPVALYEYLIRTYTQPGDLVVDPCCGSGTTAIAARNTKRHYLCGDTSREYVEAARLRLHGTGIDRLNAKDPAPLDELPLFAAAHA